MTNWNIIAGVCIIVLCGAILCIRFFRSGKKKITMDEFIDLYGDNIIGVLQDVIDVLKIDMKNFNSKEEYEEAIINNTITALKENAIEFGIPTQVVDLIDTDSLTSIIQKIFTDNKVNSFSVLDVGTMQKNKEIIDLEVVEALSPAVESDNGENTKNEEADNTNT